jgi:hypothetical protein
MHGIPDLKIELKNVMKKRFTRDCYSVEMEYFETPEFTMINQSGLLISPYINLNEQ